MKKKRNSELTPNEQLLMDIFWKENRPLTSVDLAEYLPEDCQEWKNGYLHNLLKALSDKHMLHVTTIIQYGRRFAKQYEPILTKEEYAARIVSSLNFKEESVPKITCALIKEISGDDRERIISELENIVEMMKKNSYE